jgi:hypothetical protein
LAATLGDGPYERVGGWKDARSDVRAVISIAGPYDLNTLSWGNLWTPLNTKDLEKARWIASPIHQITPKTRPILITIPTMTSRCRFSRRWTWSRIRLSQRLVPMTTEPRRGSSWSPQSVTPKP